MEHDWRERESNQDARWLPPSTAHLSPLGANQCGCCWLSGRLDLILRQKCCESAFDERSRLDNVPVIRFDTLVLHSEPLLLYIWTFLPLLNILSSQIEFISFNNVTTQPSCQDVLAVYISANRRYVQGWYLYQMWHIMFMLYDY